MWFVLRPLIFYLESLVFRYIPLARGDVWEKRWGGWHPRCQRKKNIYMGGEASSLAGDFLRKEEGNFYLAPLLLPFFITAEHDRAFLLELRCNSFISLLAFAALLRKVISNLLLYARSSCYGRLLSILPDIHSGAESEVSICPLPNECQ